MTLLAPAPTERLGAPAEEVPLRLDLGLTPVDRVFRGVLGTSGLVVLGLLAFLVGFLVYHSWWALRTFKFHFFTGTVWSAPLHPGVLGLLEGTVAIAVIAAAVGTPIALATALMINEYAHRQARGWLTGLVDLLATVPSIVYGFWGLQAVNRYAHGPVVWLAEHAGFIPIFRTSEPGNYGDSVFLCGLIVAIMIVPVVASVSREVMAQAPRDACEAALALGGTRWGTVTDVILPFSLTGIIGGILLALSRALGETMAVVLVLSNNNQVTKAILGPGGGSISKQIADTFPVADLHSQSELCLAGLTLFVTTLAFGLGGRWLASRRSGAMRTMGAANGAAGRWIP